MVGHMLRMNAFEAGLIAFGAALNISVGYLVTALRLPLYLDSIGTVLIAVLCGWQYGVLAGFAALIVLAVTSSPTVIAYAGTTIVIAALSSALARMGFLRKIPSTIIGGLIIGIAAAFASLPVTTFLYEGVSLAGADAITTVFKATGMPVWQSVLFGSLVTDPVDKLATSLIALVLIRSLPSGLLSRFTGARKVVGESGSPNTMTQRSGE
jgi:energy-coupling factor transport system substrate-specific component